MFLFSIRKVCHALLAFLLPVALALASLPAAAAPQTVDTATVLYASPGGLTSGACNNWASACELAYLLPTAPAGSEIWAKEGIYTPTTDIERCATFSLKNGVALYGGFAGDETQREQRDPETNVTTLSGEIGAVGSSDNSYHVVTGSNTDATAVLDGFTISGGNADGATFPNDCGGGMFNDNGSPTLANLIIYNNSAESGGGMYNYDHSSPTLTNITFKENTATNCGGMFNVESSGPILANGTFNGNSATNNGGGMCNGNGSSPTLNNVTFSSNNAHGGAGMENYSNSHPTLINVTFSGNTASYNGGGMENASGMYGLSSNPTLINVTFSDNSATDSGGAIFNFGSNPIIHNSILWGNSAPDGPQIYNVSLSAPTITFSAVEGGCPAGSDCTEVINENPLLGTLGDYGGNTQTIPLLPGSPAIDAADDAICPGNDQRGVTRPQGEGCDMGAFEFVKVDMVTTLALVSFANPATIGEVITFTATLSVPPPGSGSPTGNVTFYDGAVSLGTQVLSGNNAAFSTSSLALGVHNITASYSGDDYFNPSTSAALLQVINPYRVFLPMTSR
ncbi:MAG: Ig-like domain repeat protein [Anaerolineales bacterium]|nr:Ig-like domain repeat protein [Anaerolineales bacterium]